MSELTKKYNSNGRSSSEAPKMQHRHLWIPHILTKPQHGHEEGSMSAHQEAERERAAPSRPCQCQQCQDKLCCLKFFCRLSGSRWGHVYSHLHGPLGRSPRTLLVKPWPPHCAAWGKAKSLHPPVLAGPCALPEGQAVDNRVDKQKASVKDRCCYGPKRPWSENVSGKVTSKCAVSVFCRSKKTFCRFMLIATLHSCMRTTFKHWRLK